MVQAPPAPARRARREIARGRRERGGPGAPPVGVASVEAPAPTHPLGAKGCGEAGATGAPPTVMNALLDALAPLGVTHLDMPATPQVVWQAIAEAEGAQAAE